MSLLLAAQRALTVPGWAKDELSRKAQATPSLDLRFADNKSLVDATTGQNLVSFTRASSGTYVDSQGVIKTATTNLATFSEALNDASWTKNASTITSDATTAPNGSLTADKVVEDTSNGSHGVVKYPTVSPNSTITASAYVKKAERQYLRLTTGDAYGNNSAGIRINLDTGTIAGTFTSGTNPPANLSAQIQAVGDGWYRVSITCTLTGSSVNSAINVNAVDSGYFGYTGNGTSGFFLWGAQLEQSSTVGEYIPTTSTINSAPRFDHNPTTGESLGLLVEESRTNLALRSEQFDDAAWNSAAGARTVTANQITAPDGTTTADLVTADSTNAPHFVSQAFTLSAIPYSLSVFAKAGTESTVILRTFNALGNVSGTFNLNTGTVASNSAGTTAQIVAYPNGWYRCILNFTPVATTGSIGIYLSSLTAVTISTTLYLWGAQLEAGAFPTSYIPTTAATATRSADVASISGSNFSSWYRQDEGTVFAEAQFPAGTAVNSSSRSVFDATDGSTNNRVNLRPIGGGITADQLTIRSVGSTTAQFSSNGTAVSTASRKLAAVYKVDDFASWATGATSVATDTSGAIPVGVNQVIIGGTVGATEYLSGTIRRLTFWPQRLSNSTLQSITQ